MFIISLVENANVTERNIADCNVNGIVRNIGILKALNLDVGVWIQRLCNLSRNVVKLYAEQLRLR